METRLRRTAAAVAALLLAAEAVAALFALVVLGLAVRSQHISIAGLDPGLGTVGAWIGGGLLAAFLLLCTVLLARSAATDRLPGRAARIALIACAVLDAVLAAAGAGLIGWAAFAYLAVALVLVVLSLVPAPTPAPAQPPGGGATAP